VNPLYNERNLQQVSAEPALLAEVTGNLGKTGVPVLDTLSTAVQSKESLVSVASKASLDSTILIAIPLVMSYFVTMLLQRSTDDDSVGIVSTILNSIVKPISQWVPALLLVKYGTIWLSVLHLVLKKASPVIFGYTELANNAKTLAQIFQDTGECIVIVLAFRIILNVKDTFLSEMQRASQQKSKKSGGEVLGLSRFIESIKSITSVIGWIFCGYQSLLAFGFNPLPIWTSLGASSIIIGLAAQPLLSNIVSGIAIYSSRVLVVGDHVQLLTSSGSVAIDGYVEVVSPTTCVIRDEDDCLIYINNKQMSSMILRNKSQTVVAR
jgi:small-conductance mechanosensitive channel